MTTTQSPIPNHHAHYPGFAGPAGLFAAASMALGGAGNARLAAHLSELTAGDAVADIGCGPGTAARRAARAGASVVGIDPAQVMLRLARFLTRRSAHAVRYAEGSAEALPLPDSSVSVAWSIASVHHWADLDAGLREARRVLKPGRDSHGWTPEQASAFADRCLAHGFTGARMNRHGGGRRAKVSVTATAA